LAATLALGFTITSATGLVNLKFTAIYPVADRRQAPFSEIAVTADNSIFQVGDVLDSAELFVTGITGFIGMDSDTAYQHFVTLFHKAATYIPDTATVTDADLNTAIAYIESILATRPISTEIKQLMKDAANQPVVLPAKTFSSPDATYIDNYRYMVYGYSQIRIRRMIAIYLVSPEFCTQY
jgi:hypothetical protein